MLVVECNHSTKSSNEKKHIVVLPATDDRQSFLNGLSEGVWIKLSAQVEKYKLLHTDNKKKTWGRELTCTFPSTLNCNNKCYFFSCFCMLSTLCALNKFF